MRKPDMEFDKKYIREQIEFLQDVYDWLVLKVHGPSALDRMHHRKAAPEPREARTRQEWERAVGEHYEVVVREIQADVKSFRKKLRAEPGLYPISAFCRANRLKAFERFVVEVTAAIGVFGHDGYCDFSNIEVRRLAGLFYDSPEKRLDAEFYFGAGCQLGESGIIEAAGHPTGRGAESRASRIKISDSALAAVMGRTDLLAEHRAETRGYRHREEHSLGNITTPRTRLSRVVLPPDARGRILQTITLDREAGLIFDTWGLGKQIDKGKAASMLFAGPPGTGKTLAAEAVANELNKPLLSIKGSDVVSCYWGSSEKNAERVFLQADEAGAVLLFDEADSYFYRRGGGERSIDQSSNRLVNVFLSCIETFNLPVILTTNRADALDEALERRLSLKVEFEPPGRDDRLRIWRLHLPKEMPLAKGVDVKVLAGEYPLTGGEIKNAVLAAARKAAYRVTKAGGSGRVSMADLEEACREEQAGSVVMGTAERVVGFSG